MMKSSLLAIALVGALVPGSIAAQEEERPPPDIGEGAVVYAATCGRCHNPRAGTERTDREWVTIMAHMRARANMTKREAEAVLVFLQATNLPENGGAGAASSVDIQLDGAVVPRSVLEAISAVRAGMLPTGFTEPRAEEDTSKPSRGSAPS